MLNKKAIGEEILSRMKLVLGCEKDSEVASRLNLKPATIYNWKIRGSIPIEQCIELKMKFGVSLDWLVLGEGDPPEGINAVPQSNSYAQPHMDHQTVDIPIYGMRDRKELFSLGKEIGHLPFERSWIEAQKLRLNNLIAVRMPDETMAGTLNRGDTVLVNCAINNPDGVFLVVIANLLRVRRLQLMVDGSLMLSCDNPLYKPEIVPPELVEKVEIIGLCCWHGGKI